jgi:6-phosphogluconolactonase (cycloisomerase 2 family)
MRRLRIFTLPLLFLVLAAAPAPAGQIIYGTAATANSILGYCVHKGGGLAPDPIVNKPTVNNPRRVIVAGDVLYVAGNTSVEALRIESDGRLSSLGKTPRVHNANPRDIAIDPQRRMLYMPQRIQNRIAAYPLAEDGSITGDFTSCVRADVLGGWEDVEVQNGLLYASATTFRGEIDVYPIGPDGNLPEPVLDPDDIDPDVGQPCDPSNDVITERLSQRRCLAGAAALVLVDEMLYLSERFQNRLVSFRLQPDGLFSPIVPIGDGGCGSLDQQARDSKTKRSVRFIDIIEFRGTIFASFFDGGRVHAFPLKDDDAGLPTLLPKRSRRKTNREFERTPVRMTAGESADGKLTLYVSGGDNDRIEAYRLKEKPKGLLPKAKPFSRTTRIRQVFVNDVALATADAACNSEPAD